jgi:hypothetical protein
VLGETADDWGFGSQIDGAPHRSPGERPFCPWSRDVGRALATGVKAEMG